MCHDFYCISCKCCVAGHQISSVQLQFNDNQLVAKCGEHDAIAKLICCESKTICVYCRYRGHSNHQEQYETINSYANRIRELVSVEEGGVIKCNKIMENAKKHLDLTENNINIFRESLEKVLRKKKVDYISKHTSIAEEDEKRIFNEFDNLFARHVRRFPDLSPSSLLNETIKMDEVELVAEKERIIDEVIRFSAVIPTLTVGITDGINTTSDHPLGDLYTSEGEDIKISNDHIRSTVGSNILESNLLVNMSVLAEKLNNLLKECK